jgi:hypothetical protein
MTVWDDRKEALSMTPQAKLSALSEILREVPLPAPAAAILATVGVVPSSLMGVTEPTAWAAEAARAFPYITLDEPTLLEWFGSHGLAVRDEAHRAGHQQGVNEALSTGPGKELVDTLVLIREGLKAGAIKAPPLADASKPVGTPAQSLVVLVTEALAGVGL